MKKVDIESEWQEVLQNFFETETFQAISDKIKEEYLSKTVYPKPADIFKAFWLTPFSRVQVVIIGQDPYHGPGQAHGLSFSVPNKVLIPPSLQNIYKEIESDLSIKKDFTSGNLEDWAEQGVFLLNSILTVAAHKPASHRDIGWGKFTDYIIEQISEKKSGIVFMLWGNYARGKKTLIDESKHLILEAPHPSPFSARTGFFGSKHFSKCNDYLMSRQKVPIIW